jgi:hypothetical protein
MARFLHCQPWTGAALFLRDSATLVRDRRLGVRRVGRVLQDVTNEIERGVKRLVVLRIRRNIGLRVAVGTRGAVGWSDTHVRQYTLARKRDEGERARAIVGTAGNEKRRAARVWKPAAVARGYHVCTRIFGRSCAQP